MNWLRLRLREFVELGSGAGPLLMAVTVGLCGGAAAIGLRYLIEFFRNASFEGAGRMLGFLAPYHLLLVPAVGMVTVAWLTRRFAPEAAGHGIPEVQFAVRRRGGRIRPRVALVKALASALCIGTGGSVGREGPIVQIGCALGSTIGQALGLTERRVKLLLAAGGAAALAGTFNAPLGGVLFALEVLLGDFDARSFGLVVVASVTGTALCHSVLGREPAFELVQHFRLLGAWELPFYVGLGLICAVVAIAFIRVLDLLERLFARWAWPHLAKAALAGLAVGCLGLFGSELVFGVGNEGVSAALGGELAIGTLGLLVGLKILATSMTLAGGGSGGVFAPALFMGAMTGGAFGKLMGLWFPGLVAPSGAYALVGMATVFGAMAHAPISAVVILFEMTDNYESILPLMFSVVVSHLLASTISHDSIYSIPLRRRGGFAPRRAAHSVLETVLVADAMDPQVPTARPDLTVPELARRIHGGEGRSYAVLNARDELAGIVTETDVEEALLAGGAEKKTVADVMTRDVVTCIPDQSLQEVLRRFTSRSEAFRQIPVVDAATGRKLLGMLRRKEILWAYGELAQEHQALLAEAGANVASEGPDTVQLDVAVLPGHERLCYRRVREAGLPERCLIAFVHRGDHSLIPKGDTVIEPGDRLVLITTRRNAGRLRAWVQERAPSGAGGGGAP